MAATIEAAATTHRQGSARAVAVVGTAHFASHFYMLLLLPRFPLLRDVYGVGLHRARLPARQVRDLSARSATIADHRFRGSPHPGASAPPTLRLPITDPIPTPPTGAPARCASSPAPPGPQPSRHALIIAGSTKSRHLDRETSALAPTTYLTITTLPRPHRYSPNNADRRVILPILRRSSSVSILAMYSSASARAWAVGPASALSTMLMTEARAAFRRTR